DAGDEGPRGRAGPARRRAARAAAAGQRPRGHHAAGHRARGAGARAARARAAAALPARRRGGGLLHQRGGRVSTVAAAPPLHLVAPAPKARAPVNKWLVTVAVSFGTLMGAIDASIVNVALTHIRGSVGATLEEITWISTGFVVATVLVMPLTAFLGRLVGQKRLYLISLGVFLVGSALCGMAWSLWSLVFFRVIQSFGAGALQPTEQA